MATRITKHPTSKVGSHTAPVRDGNLFKSTWKVPSGATKDSDHRATSMYVGFHIYYDRSSRRNYRITKSDKYQTVGITSSQVSINNFVANSASTAADKNKTFTREDFYPYTGRMITHVEHEVYLDNSVANGNGPTSKVSTTFDVPNKPTVSAFSFDTETGTVKVKITAAKTQPRKERKLTKYVWRIQKGKFKASTQKFTLEQTMVNETDVFAGGSKSFSYDCRDYQSLVEDELYLCTLTAWSQGFSGNSEQVMKRFVVAPPASVTIRDPIVTADGDGRVTVPVTVRRKFTTKKSGSKTVNDYCVNPVDGVVLQAAVNVEAKSASSVSSSDWDDVGAVDNGDCVALTANVAELTPSQNNYTYVRVKSWRFGSDCAPMCRYSNVKALNSLRTVETATNDESAILELTPTADGTGAYLLIGYDKISGGGQRDDADGTEISWSDSSTAWKSTKQPSTFEVDWFDETASTSEGDPGYPYRSIWYYTQQVYVEGLEEGTQYWFRCRRYNDDDSGNRTYGEYCSKVWGTKTAKSTVTTDATLMPTVRPSQVTLTAPPSAPTGSDVTLTWTYDGGAQTAYRLFLGSGDKIVVESKSSASSCVLKQADYASYVTDGGTLRAMVAVSTSKRRDVFTESSWATITFAEAPVLEVAIPTVTAQPATAYLYSTTAPSVANVMIGATGSDGIDEAGIEPQVEGDDVWGALVTPTWSETTWAETAWYASNVTPAIEAADDAWDALDITTETFTGGTTADLCDVLVGDLGGLRSYVVVQPSGVPGSYMLATLVVDGDQYDLADSPVWCDSEGVEDDDGTYLRFPWPLALSDEEHLPSFVGCTITLAYLPSSDANDEAWDDYTELRATADELESLHDPDDVVYEATVEIPAGTDFRDDASYVLRATVTSATSGLASNIAEASFDVLWAHQAPAPDDEITVTPYDTTDDDGIRTIGAQIQLVEPTGATSTDMADVWRVAADGAHLIAEGRLLDELVVDEYAPFGDADLAYRVVVRTADGDVDWADYPYELDLNHSRLDFGGNYIELPFNLGIRHGYSKDSEQRQHIGDKLPRGFWGSAHSRSFSVSSDLVRNASREQMALLHELGRYMGPVLVRTPDGCCMEAEITPDTSMTYNSSAIPASIRGTEIVLTLEHMAAPSDEIEEE